MLDSPPQFSLRNYGELISGFTISGYTLTTFNPKAVRNSQNPKLFLRHDVDLDIDAALVMARFEQTQNITSTYFLLLSCPFYNLLSESAQRTVAQIQELGHEVALHVDLSLYETHDNTERAVLNELECFVRLFPYANSNIFSIHRPSTISEESKLTIEGAENVSSHMLYQKPVEYLSDSTGAWRYGHPFQSNGFRARQDLQLLIHPLWWVFQGLTPIEKVERALAERYTSTLSLVKQHLPTVFK